MLPFVTNRFAFRVLRENRRVVQDENRSEEIDHSHEVLTDISFCHCSPAVRKFIVNAYVKGANISSESSPLEGNTATPKLACGRTRVPIHNVLRAPRILNATCTFG